MHPDRKDFSAFQASTPEHLDSSWQDKFSQIKFRASIKADILEIHFTRTGVPRWADGQVNDVLGAGCRDARSSETR